MDFIHRPKSKIVKISKIKITTFRKLTLLPSSREWRLALSKGPNRIGVLLFSPSIHLWTEAEPASETLSF
jgi:hypothetical protein